MLLILPEISRDTRASLSPASFSSPALPLTLMCVFCFHGLTVGQHLLTSFYLFQLLHHTRQRVLASTHFSASHFLPISNSSLPLPRQHE